jgi:hypothetical protein
MKTPQSLNVKVEQNYEVRRNIKRLFPVNAGLQAPKKPADDEVSSW